jgi:hypothetical protein
LLLTIPTFSNRSAVLLSTSVSFDNTPGASGLVRNRQED